MQSNRTLDLSPNPSGQINPMQYQAPIHSEENKLNHSSSAPKFKAKPIKMNIFFQPYDKKEKFDVTKSREIRV